MKKSVLFSMMAIAIAFSMVLSACATATPTAAPAAPAATTAPAAPAATTAPAAPAATTAPAAPASPAATTAPAAPAFTPASLSAPDCTYGGELKSIVALDAETVQFTLCQPDVAFPAKIAFASNEILPKALLDSTGGDSNKISQAPVGTGPYILKEWVRGDHMTLTANPNYWGTPPAVKTLVLKWATEPAGRLLQLQSGDADGIDNVGPDDIATVQKDSTLKLYPRVVDNVMYLGMNNTVKPFDNESVRQAFAMAINKAQIVKEFYPAGSTVADEFVPSTLEPGYTPGLADWPYDPAKAKAMLTAAKFDFSQTFPLSFRDADRSYISQQPKVAQEIQAELASIGVKVKLDQQESATLLQNSAAGKLTFFILGWGEDYPDATDWYDYHFNEQHKDFGTPYPDIVAAYKIGTSGTDNATRQKAYDTVNQLIHQHVPLIPVAHSSSSVAMKASIGNVIIGPYNENFEDMTTSSGQLVFVQNAEPISLYFADETDGETERACRLLYTPLLDYQWGGVGSQPALATSYDKSADLTQYTFHLRPGVKFSDGSVLTANDVVASFAAQWDAKNPDHKGNKGVYEYFTTLFTQFLNAPKS
ncbi:MAG TPA: ABC transporter substrate-binding protein [Anaerolineaceae bacterium]|nr:ABC transporter substrate-binding protein [Anaerolineaceae bacterium]